MLHDLTVRIAQDQRLDGVADKIAEEVRPFLQSPAVRSWLSGTWLGHRLHPLLTDIVIGPLASAAVVDMVGGEEGHAAADTLIGVGLAASVPTVAAGLSDWVDTPAADRRVGLVHLLANDVALLLHVTSLLARRRGRRRLGKVLSLTGLGFLAAGGYLGGHLSYVLGTGVDRTAFQRGPSDWTPTVRFSDLSDGTPQAATAGDFGVLLVKHDSEVVAFSSVCTHQSGPLGEGAVVDGCVECPWHGSRFRLSDGAAVTGPAASPAPRFDVRVNEGMVEVRGRPAS